MRVVRASAWILLVLVGAISAAGLVVSLDHPPSGGARPELTARDAAILQPRLAALGVPLGRLAAGAQALSTAGRDVLVSLRALELPAATRALDAGDAALAELGFAAADVRAGASGLLAGIGEGEQLPEADRARVAAIATAGETGDGLARAWSEVGRAAAAPAALLTAVGAHEDALARAAGHGRAERWSAAMAALDEASTALATATHVRDEAGRAGRNVVALDGILTRLSAHDAALRALYAELEASDGVRTPTVDSALAAVTAAQAGLAEARDALGGAVADMGGADITPALLAIEEVRGAMEAALPIGSEP